ncbi:MAG: Splicing factor [Watsoniomyces obsoletus]|nr:MAG: Splicing factor [Watsoniomyces obsoletus]
MDINSLLSPQHSMEESGTETRESPVASYQGTESSSRKARPTSSSSGIVTQPPPVLPHNAIAEAQQVMTMPSAISSGSTRLSTILGTPLSEDRTRQPSTPGMDALADLASMQHHQHQARANASGPRSAELLDAHQLASVQSYTDVQSRKRPRGSPRPSSEHPVQESKKPARKYMAASLSSAELENIAQLASTLSEDPYRYQSHLDLIGLLRRGLTAHMQQTASSEENSNQDPRTYELLPDLRQARESMEARFALGEELWADWITDEMRLSQNVEDRVAVLELCQRATAEEVGSVRLWSLYGDWVTRLFHSSRPGALGDLAAKHGLDDEPAWSEEDRAMGAEVFGWDMMLDVWRQGMNATEWRIHDSHLIWNRYAELILEELANGPTQQKVARLRALFEERLRTPHAAWDETFQLFSTFITSYDNAGYEETMINTTRRAADAKTLYGLREGYEVRLQRALESHDEQTEWTIWAEYLEWEMAQTRKKKSNFRLCNAVFERACLRYPTVASMWEDYVFFMVDQRLSSGTSMSPLPVLRRATRHCPWSGTLWTQYLLSSEIEEKPFHEVEEVKHSATSMGLMDIGGMEEVLKVYDAWCCYLNRRAFQEGATDEEADVAEVGIRSAIESVKELAEKKHGKEYAGDPNYRLQRIYVEYLSRSGLWERARTEVWKALVPSRGDSYEFWLRWYHWELMYWFTLDTRGGKKSTTSSSAATSVLRQALARQKLDWPEKVLEVYMDHVQGFESVGNLQAATILARKLSKAIAQRRQMESEQVAAAEMVHVQPEAVMAVSTAEAPGSSLGNSKRKRGDDEPPEHTVKKSRQSPSEHGNDDGDVMEGIQQTTTSTTAAPKRDREHTTVIVKNVPIGLPETRLRQFFRDCGKINSLNVVPEADGSSATATIEFESAEDTLAAQTRDMKEIEGRPIHVQVGIGTTIFFTNFPPTADEAWVRKLFEDCGEIIDVRFPSLKYNTHRRFCYIQFSSSEAAQRATQLHGQETETSEGQGKGKTKLKLVVKMSDPEHKQSRTGAIYEGREIYCSNVDWSVSEDELRSLFNKYGTVERVNIPRNIAGKSKGFAFIVFSKPEEALEAVKEMNLMKLKSRLLNVSMAEKNPTKRVASTIIQNQNQTRDASVSASPAPENDDGTRTRSTASEDHGNNITRDTKPTREDLQSRTLALLNIPDTVNDARIRALMESYGDLTKLVLRPDHQGAIVEYKDTNSAGRAALGIEGHEIVPGRSITVGGSVRDLFGLKGDGRDERGKSAGGGSGKEKEMGKENGKEKGMTMTMAMQIHQGGGPIRRPGLGSGRRGGNLGVKRGGGRQGRGGGGGGPTTTDTKKGEEESSSSTTKKEEELGMKKEEEGEKKDTKKEGKKTNADFKKMFLKGR